MASTRGTLQHTVAALVVITSAALALAFAATADAHPRDFGPWSLASPLAEVNVEAATDGCPFPSDDGRRLYIASTRTGPGAQGGIDIWVSERKNKNAPWGTPVNVGPPVNSPANDFCPSPGRHGEFMFVSTRAPGCGGADIYVTRSDGTGGWAEPHNLGCDINTTSARCGVVTSSTSRAPGAATRRSTGASWRGPGSDRRSL